MPLPIHRSTCEPPGAEKDPATHRPADDREWLERHVARHGIKPEPNQCDPVDSVYDIGENSDCSVDAMFSDNVRDLIDPFARIPHAKASFATKLVNRDLLAYEPRGGTRVRFSLMPEETSRLVDVRTSKVGDRIAALDHFVEAGYEVHLNFSPVIVHENWLADWGDCSTRSPTAPTSARNGSSQPWKARWCSYSAT